MAELKIKELCKKRGITQKDLAKRLGLSSDSTLSQALARDNLTLDYLRRIAEALDCLPGDLLPHTDLLTDDDRETLRKAIEVLNKLVNKE